MLQSDMKSLLLLLLLGTGLLAQAYPQTYAQLGTPLFEQIDNFKALAELELFKAQKQTLLAYEKNAEAAIAHGHLIDKQDPINKKEGKSYLQELRSLQKLYDIVEKSYKQQLYKSIHNDNSNSFYAITKISLPLLNSDLRLKESVVKYYKKTKTSKIASLDKLSLDHQIDLSSYAYSDALFSMKQSSQEVQERTTLEDFTPDPKRQKPVEVLMIKTATGFDLFLENHAYYDVTIELHSRELLNLSSSEKLPYVGSFSAQSRTKFLHFSIIDPRKKSLFKTTYSTYTGRLTPNYDQDYLYALPYARNKAFMLTQGFNGEMTHKGKSAYALDFQMPIGTEVHAMRDGTVVAFESRQTENGYSPAFADKSNYVIIQHSDGTMATYGHLKAQGVKVKLGQKVYKHQFIALSGNTGYSSGPHLHVHITAIKDLSSGSASVPFAFSTPQGTIISPQVRNYYASK